VLYVRLARGIVARSARPANLLPSILRGDGRAERTIGTEDTTMTTPIVTNISPGALPGSAGSVASLGTFTTAYGGPGAATLVLEADMNVTGTGTVFARIIEVLSSAVIATSQCDLGGGAASFRCVGTFTQPAGGPHSVLFELDAWTTGTASIGTGSGVFCLRGGL
jgi:hypothetical protein